MSMKQDLLNGLLKGWVTPMIAFNNYRCLSLAQRVSEWRAERNSYESYYYSCGWDSKPKPPLIIDEWLKLPNGKRVKRYRAVR
jgi:hypothetical protein